MTRSWAQLTRYKLRRNSTSIIKDLILCASVFRQEQSTWILGPLPYMHHCAQVTMCMFCKTIAIRYDALHNATLSLHT